MQTSKKRLPGPLKAVIVAVVFVIVAVLLGIVIAIPYEKSLDQDFNTVVIGGSEAAWGMNMPCLDNDDILAINLAVAPATMIARRDILQSALDKYDLDTVIIDASYDVLSAETAYWSTLNTSTAIPKMVTFKSKVQYSVQDAKIPWYDYSYLIGWYLAEAYNAWNAVFGGDYDEYVKLGGSVEEAPLDMSLTPEDAAVKYHETYYGLPLLEENEMYFRDMIQMCQDAGVRTIVITLPLPESTYWCISNMDERIGELENVLSDYDVEYYDFNRLMGRKEFLSDHYSFRDATHMCWIGSMDFSNFFREEVLEKAPEVVSLQFYDTYLETEKYSYLSNGF